MKGLVCIDLETTGLDPIKHQVVEVAYWCMDSGVRDAFVPAHSLDNAEHDALEVNNYFRRRLWAQSSWDEDGEALRRFHAVVDGNWIVGSNPAFDASFLKPLFLRWGLSPHPFAYAPLDLGVYAAGVLNRPIGDRLGLRQLSHILGVIPGDHSAAEDVRACGECLIELQYRANLQRAAS